MKKVILFPNQETYGGHGFKHLLTVAAPKMLANGVSQDQLDKIFIHNPAEVLSYS